MPIGTAPTRIRVFFWHQNLFGADIAWVLSAEVFNEATVSISGCVKQITAGSNQAMCVAAATMYETMDSFTPLNTLVSGETVIYGTVIPHSGGVTGGCIEFDVNSGSDATLLIRTSVTDDTAKFTLRGSTSDDPAWPWQSYSNPTWIEHQRGWWPYSWIVLPISPSFDVKAIQMQPGQQKPQMNVWVFKSNPGCPELNVNGGYGLQPADTWGSLQGNKGCWGAKLSYDFTFVNTTTDGKTYAGQARLSAQFVPPPPRVNIHRTGPVPAALSRRRATCKGKCCRCRCTRTA